MKEVIFVRHAKSDWGSEFLKDIDRPLNERGYSDAYILSEWFATHKKKPELVLTSPAVRALTTSLIFARAMQIPEQTLKLEKRIYEANTATLLSVIQEQNSSLNSLLLFGHNPGYTNMCNELSDDLFFDNLPTCGLVSYSFAVKKWTDVIPKTGKLNYYQFPKNFKNQD